MHRLISSNSSWYTTKCVIRADSDHLVCKMTWRQKKDPESRDQHVPSRRVEEYGCSAQFDDSRVTEIMSMRIKFDRVSHLLCLFNCFLQTLRWHQVQMLQRLQQLGSWVADEWVRQEPRKTTTIPQGIQGYSSQTQHLDGQIFLGPLGAKKINKIAISVDLPLSRDPQH